MQKGVGWGDSIKLNLKISYCDEIMSTDYQEKH